MARYPIGLQDFGEIRNGNYVYVDKTVYIAKLLEGSKYYFLGRPRRFGKSLFVSTLEYFFKGEKELFKGLAIDSYDWNWAEYPVFHIDFTQENYSVAGHLTQRIDLILSQYEEFYQIASKNHLSISARFENLIRRTFEKTGRQVVVLVDEYEKPVIDLIGNPAMLEEHREILRGFYSVLKASDKYLKLVFLTGVTKFGQMSVFSGLNNLNDISMHVEFGSICGITQQELEFNFKEGIESIARNLEVSSEDALLLLKQHYDGYHFCKRSDDIYNPFSLNCAFNKREIEPFWSRTGAPTILINILKRQSLDVRDLEGIKVTENQLIDINDQFDKAAPLFYQTGYLTIKDYDRDLKLYTLGFPNQEVRVSFIDDLLPLYIKKSRVDENSFVNQLSEAFYIGEPQKAMEILEQFSASISYEVIPAPDVERHFQYMIYLISKLILSRTTNVKVEEKTSNGRIDLLIETPRYVYIIEIKRDSTAEDGLRQIEDKGYALPYKNDGRKIFLIGMNFSTEKRRLDKWQIINN